MVYGPYGFHIHQPFYHINLFDHRRQPGPEGNREKADHDYGEHFPSSAAGGRNQA